MPPPEVIRIAPDDSHFQDVGLFADGTQFLAFVTGAHPGGEFPPPRGPNLKQWLAVVHLFDEDGAHLSTSVRLGGLDAEGRRVAQEKASEALDTLLDELFDREPTSTDIWVRPFALTIDGVKHGLVYETEGDDEWVMFWPRDLMFHPPWDSAEYSS